MELEQTQRRTHAARRAKRAGPDAISSPDAGCRAAQGSSCCAPPAEPDGRGGSVRTFLGKEEKYWPTTRCAPGFGPACTPRLRNLSGSNGWRYPIPEISFEISQDHLKAFAEIYKKMKYNKWNTSRLYASINIYFQQENCVLFSIQKFKIFFESNVLCVRVQTHFEHCLTEKCVLVYGHLHFFWNPKRL